MTAAPRPRVDTLEQAIERVCDTLRDPLTLAILRNSLRGNDRVEFRFAIDHAADGMLRASLQRKIVARTVPIWQFYRVTDPVATPPVDPAPEQSLARARACVDTPDDSAGCAESGPSQTPTELETTP